MGVDWKMNGRLWSRRRFCLLAVAGAAGIVLPAAANADGLRQRRFKSPEAAASALGEAYRHGNRRRIAEILGDEAFRLVSSGDAVVDRLERDWFLSLFRESHEIEPNGESLATLLLGADRQPYPIPILRDAGLWRFDKTEGHEDLISRRMAKNELSALGVVVAMAQAQNEYLERSVEWSGARAYAKHIVDRDGRRDALIWAARDGSAAGPLAAIAAAARREGYRRSPNGNDESYRGYHYRILAAQGPRAPGGARDYRGPDGRLTGGFALVAFPIRYGVSGIMTFLVGRDEVAYQKDLGPDTVPIARGMTRFDPDDSWTRGK